MAYSEKLIDHYENPRNIGSLDKTAEDVGTGPGRRAGLWRRDEAADQGRPGRADRGRQVQDLRLRFGDRLQLARDRVGQGQDDRRGRDHQEHRHRTPSGAAAGEDPLLRPCRRMPSRRPSPTIEPRPPRKTTRPTRPSSQSGAQRMTTTTETPKPAAPAAPRPRRPRPQLMMVTPLAAERVKGLNRGTRQADRGHPHRRAHQGLLGPQLHAGVRRQAGADGRGYRGQRHQAAGRPEGLAVPDRHRDGLRGREAEVGLRVQEPEREGPLRAAANPSTSEDPSWIISRGWECRRR